MNQILTVTTPTGDLQLLTTSEMRAAAGITDATQDDALAALSLRVAAAITAECNVAVGAGYEPTLKQETLTETFRAVNAECLALSRRHNVTITSATVDGTLYDAAEYEVQSESGLLFRLSNDFRVKWCGRKITVVYQAGFSTVPADLKMAAMEFVGIAWREMGRDPSLKSQEIDIPGVERVKNDFWVGVVPGLSYEGTVPGQISGQLQRFRNAAL